MDSSISGMEYVKKGHKVPYNELTSMQWLEVVKDALMHLRPVLKYMPSIRDPGAAIEQISDWKLYRVDFPTRGNWVGGYSYHYSHPHHDFGEDIRLIPVGPLVLSRRAGWLDFETGDWEDGKNTDTHLFISTKEKWVSLERLFVRNSTNSYLPRVYVQDFTYRVLLEDELVQLIGDNLSCWPRMLHYLGRLAWREVENKRHHIEVLERAAEEMDVRWSRIDSHS